MIEPLLLGIVLGLVPITILGLFVAAVIFSNAVMAGRLYAARYVGQRVVHDIRNDLYTHLSSKSMSFFDRHQTGDLMSRVTNDVNMIQFFFNMAGTVILSSIAMILFTLMLINLLVLVLLKVVV